MGVLRGIGVIRVAGQGSTHKNSRCSARSLSSFAYSRPIALTNACHSLHRSCSCRSKVKPACMHRKIIRFVTSTKRRLYTLFPWCTAHRSYARRPVSEADFHHVHTPKVSSRC